MSEPNQRKASVGPQGLAFADACETHLLALAGVGRAVQGESLKALDTSLACSAPPAAGPLPARLSEAHASEKSMKRVILAALAAVLLAAGHVGATEVDPRWTRMTEIFTRNDNAYSRGDVFVNSYTGVHRPPSCAAGQWCTIDVTDYGVPADAKAVFLSGILIITHGTKPELADMFVGFRAYGDAAVTGDLPFPGGTWYVGQVIETDTQSGQRSPMATWVPVRDGKFQFTYSVTTPGTWPDHSSYGVNLTIQAWGR